MLNLLAHQFSVAFVTLQVQRVTVVHNCLSTGFFDFQQLFMSANSSPSPSSNPSPADRSAEQSLLEKAGLAGSEAEPVEESSKDCVVCQNGGVNWVLLPCRHTCLCDSCVRYFKQCPMCRQFVQESFALCSQKEPDKDMLETS